MKNNYNQLVERIQSIVNERLNEEFGQPLGIREKYDYILSLFYDGYFDDMAQEYMNVEKPMNFLNYAKTVLNPGIYTRFLERLVINLV